MYRNSNLVVAIHELPLQADLKFSEGHVSRLLPEDDPVSTSRSATDGKETCRG